jgi:2-polyprenyl-3-methyl-5-hydroxy-6-metoxy-1,4-benzoquinol methylase
MVHHKVCPLCSSEKISLLLSCKDYFVSKEEFPIFRCSDCGFSFTQDYPEENEIGSFYESDEYISHSDTAKGFANQVYRVARSLMLRKKRDLIQHITGLKQGSIVDIGSGTGYFASVMKKSGWRVRGIEINEKARNFSISHFGLEVSSPGQLSSIDSDSFDCVTLWHVLEHFHNPFEYMLEIRRVLKPGAFCVIALPNSGSYDTIHFGQYWAAWDVPRHLWHFKPSTFRVFSEKTGFSLEDMKTLPLDVFYISQLSEKYKGSSLYFLKGIVIASAFAFLTMFNKKRSSSVIYILRKPVD